MPENRLDCWQIGPALHQMCGKAVSKQMRSNGFGDARSLRRFAAGFPHHFGGDRLVGAQPLTVPGIDTSSASSTASIHATSRAVSDSTVHHGPGRPLPWRMWMSMRSLSISSTFSWHISALRIPVE